MDIFYLEGISIIVCFDRNWPDDNVHCAIDKTPPPSRGRMGGGWVQDGPIPTLALPLKGRETILERASD
jgi:hypothetical protein